VDSVDPFADFERETDFIYALRLAYQPRTSLLTGGADDPHRTREWIASIVGANGANLVECYWTSQSTVAPNIFVDQVMAIFIVKDPNWTYDETGKKVLLKYRVADLPHETALAVVRAIDDSGEMLVFGGERLFTAREMVGGFSGEEGTAHWWFGGRKSKTGEDERADGEA
jgi:hypothetical protein